MCTFGSLSLEFVTHPGFVPTPLHKLANSLRVGMDDSNGDPSFANFVHGNAFRNLLHIHLDALVVLENILEQWIPPANHLTSVDTSLHLHHMDLKIPGNSRIVAGCHCLDSVRKKRDFALNFVMEIKQTLDVEAMVSLLTLSPTRTLSMAMTTSALATTSAIPLAILVTTASATMTSAAVPFSHSPVTSTSAPAVTMTASPTTKVRDKLLSFCDVLFASLCDFARSRWVSLHDTPLFWAVSF